jgi:hypothetical protein
MAKRTTTPAPTTGRTVKRKYQVVRVNGDGTQVKIDVPTARSQDEAMDMVVDGMSAEDRNVELGAYLAGSYRQRRYKSEQTWKTTSEDTTPGDGEEAEAEAEKPDLELAS